MAKTWSILFVVSNSPIVICLRCQLDPEKLITRTKISCAPLDIHKSKFVVDIQSPNFGKTYNYFIFFTNLGNISLKHCFLEENITQGHRCKIKCLNQTFSTNYNGNWSFTIRRPRSCKKSFCCSSSFFKGFLILKHLNIALLEIFIFF